MSPPQGSLHQVDRAGGGRQALAFGTPGRRAASIACGGTRPPGSLFVTWYPWRAPSTAPAMTCRAMKARMTGCPPHGQSLGPQRHSLVTAGRYQRP
jgi:hypothetical protein